MFKMKKRNAFVLVMSCTIELFDTLLLRKYLQAEFHIFNICYAK